MRMDFRRRQCAPHWSVTTSAIRKHSAAWRRYFSGLMTLPPANYAKLALDRKGSRQLTILNWTEASELGQHQPPTERGLPLPWFDRALGRGPA
jgi:hypothetical protein